MTETPSFECGKFYPGQGPGNRRDYEPPVTPKRHPRRRRRDGEPWGPKGPIRDKPPTRLVLRTCWICKERPATDPDGFACGRDGLPAANGPCRCRLRTDRFCEKKETWVPDLPGATNCPTNQFQTEAACASVCRDGVDVVCPEFPCIYYLCCIKEANEERVPCPEYGPGCTCPKLTEATCEIDDAGTIGLNEQCPPPPVGCLNGGILVAWSLNNTQACNSPECRDRLGPPRCPEPDRPSTEPQSFFCPPKTCVYCDIRPPQGDEGSWSQCVPPNNPLCRCRITQVRECKTVQLQGTRNPVTGECEYPPITNPFSYGCEPESLNACLAGCRPIIEEDCNFGERRGPLPPGPGPSTPGGPTGPGPSTPGPGESTGTSPISKNCKFCIQTITTGYEPCVGPNGQPNCRCQKIYNRICETKQVFRRPNGTFPNCTTVQPTGTIVNSPPYSSCAPIDGQPCTNKRGPPQCPEEPSRLGETTGTPLPQSVTWYVCLRATTASTGVGAVLAGGCFARSSVNRPPNGYATLVECENVCSRPQGEPTGTGTGGGPVPLVERYSCNQINGKCRRVFVPQNQTTGTYATLAACERECKLRAEGSEIVNTTNLPDPIGTYFRCNKATGNCSPVFTTKTTADREGYFSDVNACRLRCRSNTAEADRLSRTTLGGISQVEIGEGSNGGIISDPTELRTYYKCINGTCITSTATPQQATNPNYHTTLQACLNYCQNNKNSGPISVNRLGEGILTDPIILDDGGADDGPVIIERTPPLDDIGETTLPNGENNPNRPKVNPSDANVSTRPYYELPENNGAGTVNLDPAAAVYVPPVLDFSEAVVVNYRQTDLFAEYIHEAINYYLDKNNTSEDWRSYYSSDLTIQNIERSLKPSAIKIFEAITDQKGDLIGKEYFLEVIRGKLINGTISDFNLPYYRKLAEKSKKRVVKPIKQQDQIVNTLQAFAYLENKLIPLDPDKGTGRTSKLTPLIKTLATDLEKSLTVIVNDEERKFYINDDDIVVGRANLKISDGDYITVGVGTGQRRIYLDTEKDHAYLISDLDKEIALNLLGGDSSIRLTASATFAVNLEFNYPLTGARENVYFLKLKTESVVTDRATEYIDNTTARYDLCSINTQQDLDAINEYVKFKANHYLFPVHPDDVFLDYVVSSGHLYLQQQDIRFDGHARKTNKNIPLLVRQLPWYILLFPTNKEENNPFDIQSDLIEFESGARTTRELIFEMSIDSDEYDANITTAKFVNIGTVYPDENVYGEYDLDSRKVIFDPSSTFFSSGYKEEKTTQRPRTPLRKIKEIISELNNNYVLDRGLTTFDVFSRLNFTDFNKFISNRTNKVIFDKIKEGAIENVKVYEVTKYSGDAYLNKTALLRRRSAATTDTYPQIRSLNSGEYIEPPTQTEAPRIITSTPKQIKPLQ